MDTEKCAVLLKAIETGSLSAAGAALGYTPSGVSRMMAALEDETGFRLLCRSRGGVAPTKECEELLPAVRELVRLGSQYAQTAAGIRGLEYGELVLGTSYSVYYRWLSSLVADFTKMHPGIRVRVFEGSSSQLCKALEEHRADLCIISRRRGDFRWIPLREDEMVAWVPEGHPLASLERFPFSAFASEPYIDIFPGQETDNSLALAKNHIRPNTRFTTSDVNAAYSMAGAGLGVSLVNSLVSGGRTGPVRIMPLDPPELVSIGIAVALEEVISPAAESFVEFAKSRLDELA